MLGLKTWSALLQNLSKCQLPPAERETGRAWDGTFWAPPTPPGLPTSDHPHVVHVPLGRRLPVPLQANRFIFK